MFPKCDTFIWRAFRNADSHVWVSLSPWGGTLELEFLSLFLVVLAFPGGSSGKKPTCQGRRHEFHPWVGKIPWRRKWHPTPVFLPGESHGQRSLEGYSPWGGKKSDRTEHAPTWHLCLWYHMLWAGERGGQGSCPFRLNLALSGCGSWETTGPARWLLKPPCPSC